MLSSAQILDAFGNGRIIIAPFDEQNLGTNSYDVRLGDYFYRETETDGIYHIFDIYDEEHVKKVWGRVEAG
jgi:dCTP deaminase